MTYWVNVGDRERVELLIRVAWERFGSEPQREGKMLCHWRSSSGALIDRASRPRL
jgi:hypothetical protein